MPSQNVSVRGPNTSVTAASTSARMWGFSNILSANDEPLGKLTTSSVPSSLVAMELESSDPRAGMRDTRLETTVRHWRCSAPLSRAVEGFAGAAVGAGSGWGTGAGAG